MSTTKGHVDATPQAVYDHLTKSIDDLDPGPLKVGQQFRVDSQATTFTVTLVEPPNRFGFSTLVGDVTTTMSYTILPEGTGSLVQVELDESSPSTPLLGMVMGAFLEGRSERHALDELKAAFVK